MRRIICTDFTEPPVLEVLEGPTPEPGPGEVLLDVGAVGLSFVDGLIVRGGYQLRPQLPFTPGSCVVGRVCAVGEGVDRARIGTQVATVLAQFGACATHVTASDGGVVPLPAGVDPDVAAAAMESYLTLVFATTHRIPIEPGEDVVVLGAGGSIGRAAIDVARSLGARVIAVASTQEKRAVAEAAGAEVTLGYADLKDAIRQVTGGGADVVIDPVGGPAAESALRALGAGGRFCVVGFASGEIPRLPMNIVLLRNRTIVGVDWGDWTREVGRAEGNAALIADFFGRVARGELHPAKPVAVSLEEAVHVLREIGVRSRSAITYVLTP